MTTARLIKKSDVGGAAERPAPVFRQAASDGLRLAVVQKLAQGPTRQAAARAAFHKLFECA